MVFCKIDGNEIFVEAMKSRTEGEIIRAHKGLLEHLQGVGIFPKEQCFDNEAW